MRKCFLIYNKSGQKCFALTSDKGDCLSFLVNDNKLTNIVLKDEDIFKIVFEFSLKDGKLLCNGKTFSLAKKSALAILANLAPENFLGALPSILNIMNDDSFFDLEIFSSVSENILYKELMDSRFSSIIKDIPRFNKLGVIHIQLETLNNSQLFVTNTLPKMVASNVKHIVDSELENMLREMIARELIPSKLK